MLKKSLLAPTEPKANDEQITVIDDIRITVLTSRLIRVEKGEFCDMATFAVWFRRFDTVNAHVKKSGKEIIVETDDVIFVIDRNGVPYSVKFKDSGKVEIFSRTKNLKGTARTVDMHSKVRLGDGLITDRGVYLLDDSKTLLIDEGGHLIPRDGKNSRDFYVFAYGKDYRQTVRAFYAISSPAPLVPRYSLGVWWSRYHAYTQEEYLELMERFEREDIPLTVATVDMDWHWVKGIKEKFGVKYRGWTGYSWNTDLFPDYREFLKKLKSRGLHITLNLHPADGVYCYEDMYEQMAQAVGVDPKTKEKVDFVCSDDNFWNAYFDILHKPYEKEGVDFWWIDWQQGKGSDVKGLDPLNVLNHYHYLDNAENGEIPLILSRYAGVGSHRYPLGFSGDSLMNWKSLDFQPYFTANAANIAYTWWSHDIGGHTMGYRDDDLYMRWLQLGVFSPILRLHSSEFELLGKEPWKYKSEVYKTAKEWLNFRHRLIPYLFTMNHRTHSEGIALCEPMYYSYPDCDEAYRFPNEYMFGSELLVCPITKPQNKNINLGSVKAWIPEGRWTDIFTGQAYEGSEILTLFRDLDTIPVLAKEGAIIPLSADKGNSTENPENVEIWAFSGNGEFTLIEDNSKTDFEEHTAKTKFEISYDKTSVTFTVNEAQGDLSVVPGVRNYTVIIKDLYKDDQPVKLILESVEADKGRTVTVSGVSRKAPEDPYEGAVRIVSRLKGNSIIKFLRFLPVQKDKSAKGVEKAIKRANLPKSVKLAIKEVLVQK